MTSAQNDRKAMALQALQNIQWLVDNASSDRTVPHKVPLGKEEFVQLLKANFDKLDKDKSNSISRSEITHALDEVADYSASEYIMLQLLMRYFDFISDLVDESDTTEKVVSRTDVDTLAEFLLESNLTLEALYMWCSGPSGPPKGDLIKPPPLSADDKK